MKSSEKLWTSVYSDPYEYLPLNLCCFHVQAEEAKVKISEVSGERVDHEAKLKVISQEEEAIKKEKEVRQRFSKS